MRSTGLPPELVTLLHVERKKRIWRRYLPLFGGAAVVGLVVGAVPSLWPRAAIEGDIEAPAIAPETVVEQRPSADDVAWAAGSRDSGAGSAGRVNAKFGFCHTGGGYNCVVDGDTIWLEGQNIRIADIDAPETHEYGCAEEKALGDRATQRLHELVNSEPVTLKAIDRDQDRYGRKLRIVMVNGTSVGDTLVSEGLARYYGGRKRPWC